MIMTARRASWKPDALGNIFVETVRTRQVLDRMNDVVTEGYDAQYCYLLSILGPPRCGKTSLIQAFDDEHERRTEKSRPYRILEVQVPTRPSLKDLVTAMLLALNDPAADHGTIHTKTVRAVRLLARGGYDLVVYDEIHRVAAGRTETTGSSAAEWITDLLNMRICPAIGIGEPSFDRLLASKPYLDGRSFGVEYVMPCDWADKQQRMDFRIMIRGICERLGMPEVCDFSDPKTARQLAVFSNGRIGYVANLITTARLLARGAGATTVTKAHLREAVDRESLKATGPGFNPFSLEEDDPRLSYAAANQEAPDAAL